MATRLLLAVLIHVFTAVDLVRCYTFVDSECLSRYSCTLKPSLPCDVTVLHVCPPTARKTHWPGKPLDLKVEEYDSGLRGGECYGRENVTWRIPNDVSALRITGFMVSVVCLSGHCAGHTECIYFNMSAAAWTLDDYVEKMQYSFDCLRPLRGKYFIEVSTLPKAHDSSNIVNHTVRLPLKGCQSLTSKPPTTSSTHRPASPTASGGITTSGIHNTPISTQKTTMTFDTSTPDVSTTLSLGQSTHTRAMSPSLSQTTGRTDSGIFTVVAILLGCVCGVLLSILLLYFVYKHYRRTRTSHQKSSSGENNGNHVTFNRACNSVVINCPGNGHIAPDSMPTLETTISGNTERFWDEGPFKPPEPVDLDTLSTTTSELSRAVRAFNEEDAEQQRVNGASFRPFEAGFHRIDESEEAYSIAGTSV